MIYELPQKPETKPEDEPSSCPPESDFTLSSPPSSEKTPSEILTQINKDLERIDQQTTDLIKFDSIPSAEAKEPDRTDAIPAQELELYQEVVRENIAYDQLVAETPSDQPLLDEIISLMTETICSRQPTIRVAREHWPAGVVQSRLLKLNREHIRFVMDCMRENTTQIKHIRQYLLTALFHAPNTISSYYNARVNHDLMRNTGIQYTSTERAPTVLPELAELLPPLSEEQLSALRADLERNGCYAPVIVNEDLVIV